MLRIEPCLQLLLTQSSQQIVLTDLSIALVTCVRNAAFWMAAAASWVTAKVVGPPLATAPRR